MRRLRRLALASFGKEGVMMYPFREGDASATFRNIVDSVTAEIKALENEHVLKASETELEQYYIEKAIIEPLTLYSDQQYIDDHSGTQIDVSHDVRRAVFAGERAEVRGTKIDIAIPFEGDPMLWRLRASTWSTGGYPEIDVRDGEILFSISFPDDSANPDQLKSDIDRNIKSLEGAVGYLKKDVDRHNASVPGAIQDALTRKREMARSTTGAVAALGIPMKRANSSPAFSV